MRRRGARTPRRGSLRHEGGFRLVDVACAHVGEQRVERVEVSRMVEQPLDEGRIGDGVGDGSASAGLISM